MKLLAACPVQARNWRRYKASDLLPLAESEARLEFALAAGRLGYWEMEPASRKLFGSDIYKANWGRKTDDPFNYEILRAAVHPEDLALHEAGDIVGAAVGNARARELRSEGKAMSMDEAITYALASIEP